MLHMIFLRCCIFFFDMLDVGVCLILIILCCFDYEDVCVFDYEARLPISN